MAESQIEIQIFRNDFNFNEDRLLNIIILAFAFITGLTTVTANAAMIDNFDEESMSADTGFVPTIASASATSNTPISAFGGNRTITITKNGDLSANAKVSAPLGIYEHSTDALTSATSTISWHSDTAIDLMEGRSNSNFALDILKLDQGDVSLILSVIDMSDATAEVTKLNADVGVEFFDFNDFTGIDFLHITDISLKIVGGGASDLTLNSISVVPTPSILILLSMGLLAFAFTRRIAV